MLERHLRGADPESVYDAFLIPALCYAERDRLEKRLSRQDEDEVFQATAELVGDASAASGGAPAPSGAAADPERAIVRACPSNARSDELALRMLGLLLAPTPVRLEVLSAHALASEILTAVQERDCKLVCIADLPPSPPSKTRYLVKKLRAAAPDLKILVGRWAPPSLADDHPGALSEAGADHVATTLIETRAQIVQLAALDVAKPVP
jgi:hypothetical protein